MLIKYDINIEPKSIEVNLQRLVNQLYKLLPIREEGEDWRAPLETIIVELSGMDRLVEKEGTLFFKLLCKLEGLFLMSSEDDFPLYRRTIFECLNLVGELLKRCQDWID